MIEVIFRVRVVEDRNIVEDGQEDMDQISDEEPPVHSEPSENSLRSCIDNCGKDTDGSHSCTGCSEWIHGMCGQALGDDEMQRTCSNCIGDIYIYIS